MENVEANSVDDRVCVVVFGSARRGAGEGRGGCGQEGFDRPIQQHPGCPGSQFLNSTHRGAYAQNTSNPLPYRRGLWNEV